MRKVALVLVATAGLFALAPSAYALNPQPEPPSAQNPRVAKTVIPATRSIKMRPGDRRLPRHVKPIQAR
jgi:hypothetical protein